jgi:anti-sigma factor RsiW
VTCEEVVDLLVDYVDGGLSAEQVDAIKQHLCGCQPCVATVEMYQVTIKVTRALPKVEPLPPAFEARLRAVLAAQPGGEAS